jgi:hypothetical protein
MILKLAKCSPILKKIKKIQTMSLMNSNRIMLRKTIIAFVQGDQ